MPGFASYPGDDSQDRQAPHVHGVTRSGGVDTEISERDMRVCRTGIKICMVSWIEEANEGVRTVDRKSRFGREGERADDHVQIGRPAVYDFATGCRGARK
ncbi:MAG: hypothetical protein CL933_08735 [Deltaproteobacteria bacterium]|nr:hypothetical protein [Deltaproteobacteria bacterium]